MSESESDDSELVFICKNVTLERIELAERIERACDASTGRGSDFTSARF